MDAPVALYETLPRLPPSEWKILIDQVRQNLIELVADKSIKSDTLFDLFYYYSYLKDNISSQAYRSWIKISPSYSQSARDESLKIQKYFDEMLRNRWLKDLEERAVGYDKVSYHARQGPTGEKYTSDKYRPQTDFESSQVREYAINALKIVEEREIGGIALRLAGYLPPIQHSVEWYQRSSTLNPDIVLQSFGADIRAFIEGPGWQWYYFGFFSPQYIQLLGAELSPEVFEAQTVLPLDLGDQLHALYRNPVPYSPEVYAQLASTLRQKEIAWDSSYFGGLIPTLKALLQDYEKDYPGLLKRADENPLSNLIALLTPHADELPLYRHSGGMARTLVQNGLFSPYPPACGRIRPAIWSKRKIRTALVNIGALDVSRDSYRVPQDLLGTPSRLVFGSEFKTRFADYTSYYQQMIYRYALGTLDRIDWGKACGSYLLTDERLLSLAEEMKVSSEGSYEEICARLQAISAERRSLREALKFTISPDYASSLLLQPGGINVSSGVRSEAYRVAPRIPPSIEALLSRCENLDKLPKAAILDILRQLGLEKYLPENPLSLTTEKACAILKRYTETLASAYPPYYPGLEEARALNRPKVYTGPVPPLEKLKERSIKK